MLTLLAPDFSSLDTIWRNPLPFALWPVGHQSLLAHWMDESVRTGKTEVRIFAADRPADIRRVLEGGGYWSRSIEVIPIVNDAAAPADAIRVDRLPLQSEDLLPVDGARELLERWLTLQKFWLEHRKAGNVEIDQETVPGGWVGPLARIHPGAVLIPPYWIGPRATVGAGCKVGPFAWIGADSVLDARVEMENAVVLPETYLGLNTRLHRSVAQGGILVDIGRGCRVDIAETFIMGSVKQRQAAVSLPGRLLALLAAILLAPLAKCWPGQTWSRKNVRDFSGLEYSLETGTRGPLLVRRWPWLAKVVAGRMGWFGILPRGNDDLNALPGETADRLRSAHAGIFSWADLQDCHDVTAPDEWVHAAYQVLQEDDTVKRMLFRKVLRLAWFNPEV